MTLNKQKMLELVEARIERTKEDVWYKVYYFSKINEARENPVDVYED